MSFMPDVGTRVTLTDGRVAVVSHVPPLGDDDRVRFDDGHEETVSAPMIREEEAIAEHYLISDEILRHVAAQFDEEGNIFLEELARREHRRKTDDQQ